MIKMEKEEKEKSNFNHCMNKKILLENISHQIIKSQKMVKSSEATKSSIKSTPSKNRPSVKEK